MLITNVLLGTSAVVIMFLPIIIAYVLNIKILEKTYFTLSVYGIYMIFYMCVQMTFAYLNKKRIRNVHKNNLNIHGKYNILVVGYKEDPELFKGCLESISKINCSENIHKIIIVIDGNSSVDTYMADIASSLLGSVNITLQELPSDNPSVLDSLPARPRVLCIMQPHKGKRHALYTGLKLSCKCVDVDGVLCTDSDTVLNPNSMYYLANLLESDAQLGAVTGNVKIINTGSVISYLSSLRYWFACNLERAYQSFNHSVLCVSGPLGLYRTDCLERFLETWLHQTFLSQECTYGDDRHLTNNILLLGYRVGYTHLASCLTDTPESLSRFFTQQVRWCKSSYREFLWNLKCLDKHSFWMTVDLIYQTVYSFIVLGSLLYILYFGTFFQMLLYIFTLLFFNGVKGLYATVMEKNVKYLLFTLYGILYIAILAPAKIYAGITIKDVSWGTSSRLVVLNNFEIKHTWLILWNIVILFGIGYNTYANERTFFDYMALSVVSGYLLITFVLVFVLSKFIQ